MFGTKTPRKAYRNRWLWPIGGLMVAAAGAAMLLWQRREGVTSGGASASGGDDLTRIKGIGPGLERKLNKNGVTRFSQIAAWNAEDIARFDAKLQFAGRIERDEWVTQAKALA